MENQSKAAAGAAGKSVVASTVGVVLTVAVAFGLGWFASMQYLRAQAAKEQAAAAQAQAEQMRSRPVTVETARAMVREMSPAESFVGHVEPVASVDLRAQVDGTIAEVAFREGAMVKEGDLLYVIDPRVYEAKVAQAKAALEKAKAASVNADRYYERMSKVDKRAVPETDVDQAYANMLECRAAIAQCEADLRSAEINLGYTRITAPISGRIGASLLKKGDYVAPSMGTLARIIQTDPIRVVFSVSDREYLDGQRRVGGGNPADTIRAQLRLADGSIYAHDGQRDFISNEMDAGTASVAIRYSFANPKQQLLANAYVTVLLSETVPQKALAVPTASVLTNATGDYVYLVEDGRAARRTVKLGATQGGYVAILSGLEAGDEVVTDGIVNVSEGASLNVINPAVTVAEPTVQPGI